MNVIRLTAYFIFIGFLLSLFSCKAILENTLGKALYKHRYLEGQTHEKEFYYDAPYHMDNGRILVEVRINNSERKFTFLFDTGARSHISEEAAQSLGLVPVENNLTANDINNTKRKANRYLISSISVGGFKAFNIGMLSISRSDLITGCTEIDGVFGNNILDLAVFQFKQDSNRIVITNSISKLNNQNLHSAFRTEKIWYSDLILHDLHLGKKKRKVLFDSGFSGLLLFQTRDSTKVPIEESPFKERLQLVVGMHSESIRSVSFYKVDGILLGEENLGNVIVPVLIGDLESGFIIGSSIFSMCTVTLDAKNNRIYLSKVIPAKLDKQLINLRISWQKDRGAYISAITKNGNLEKMGLHLNDSIISINNSAMDQFKDQCSFDEFKMNLEKGPFEICVAVKRSKEKRLLTITPELLYE